MKILFCGYREWAVKVYVDIVLNAPTSFLQLASTHEELINKVTTESWDMIIVVGWSWKIPADIVKNNLVIGMHPSDLPRYAGGSPIQNQVLDGLKDSVATLFRLNERFDEGEILAKRPFSLEGHMDDIFKSLGAATTRLILDAIQQHPNHSFAPQGSEGFVRRRLKPEDSRLTIDAMKSMTCERLFDFIRCREDPYPNVFLEDETGKLVFKLVEFERR